MMHFVAWNFLGLCLLLGDVAADSGAMRCWVPMVCGPHGHPSWYEVTNPDSKVIEGILKRKYAKELKDVTDHVSHLTRGVADFEKAVNEFKQPTTRKTTTIDTTSAVKTKSLAEPTSSPQSQIDDSTFPAEAEPTSIGQTMTETTADICDVTYNGKCFRALLHNAEDVNLNGARDMCQNIGWNLANVNDASHYAAIDDYLRGRIPSEESIALFVWLGMTIDPQTEVVNLTSGANAELAGTKWRSTYPSSIPTHTNMAIDVNWNPNNAQQGIFNYPPNFRLNGALCEK